jgi:kynurenine formamidase
MTQRTPASKTVPKLGPHLLANRPRLVDLTREIFQGMPTYFTHQRTFISTNQTHEECKERWGIAVETHNLLMSEHAGTHTDAIFEYDPDGPHLDESPLEFYYGEAICLDLGSVKYPATITPAELEAALERSGQEIVPGDIVLLYTGHGDALWPADVYASQHPGLDRAGAEWLASRGVVNIGVDNAGIDHSDDPAIEAHLVCGEYGIVNTESLTNLDKVVNQRFLFMGLPLNIRAGTGSPIRAVALLTNDDDGGGERRCS